jgi:hypothetical protein
MYNKKLTKKGDCSTVFEINVNDKHIKNMLVSIKTIFLLNFGMNMAK